MDERDDVLETMFTLHYRRLLRRLRRRAATVRLVSVASDGTAGDADSGGPSISADGRFVGFQSLAGSLSGGDENGVRDVFVHDTASGTTGRASVAPR